MDYGRAISTLIGFSASFILCVPSIKWWQKRCRTVEKLQVVSEVLERAEQRVVRSQERHDRLLGQVCTFYLANKELEEALGSARRAMDEAMDFASGLRKMQMKLIRSFPDDVDLLVVLERRGTLTSAQEGR
ncbi:hypothetical protein ACJRO7_011130 [Eucalyptus globulus]|uniref:Uncharacterized protein n=1 Tax=Eucalyptus globulus TaxID=34317 RepID=A0ABD3LHK0_EUCGL